MRKLLAAISLVAPLLATAVTAPSAAQEALQVEINSVDASAYPEVTVTATVLDGTRRPVIGLTPEAFSATIGESPLRVVDVGGASDQGLGIGVVLTFDVSGSMEGAALAAAKEAGKALIEQLGPEDEVAVMAFSDQVALVQPFTRDRTALAAAIDGLFAGGNTALYNAVVSSAQTAAGATLPRAAVVLLSDGTDFGGGSTVDAEGSLSAVQGTGVPFFVVGLGELADQTYLEQLAAAARGRLLLAPDASALGGLYQEIGGILRHQYVLTLDAGEVAVNDGEQLTVVVTTGGASAAGSAPVRLPERLLPSPTPAPTETRDPEPKPGPVGASEEGEASAPVLLIALGSGALGVVLVLGAFAVRRFRRNRRHEDEYGPSAGGQTVPFPGRPETAGPIEAGAACVEVVSASGVRTHPIGESLTVGYTSDCSVRLEDGTGPQFEAVRIWRREGKYMLHSLSRVGTVTIGGKPVTWAVLEDGDQVQIGSQTVVFRERPT